jgi:hypothetical protein
MIDPLRKWLPALASNIGFSLILAGVWLNLRAEIANNRAVGTEIRSLIESRATDDLADLKGRVARLEARP